MKVVEGQLELWQMASSLSGPSKSMTTQLFQEFVNLQVKLQQLAPDVLPSHVEVHASIDQETGKLVSRLG